MISQYLSSVAGAEYVGEVALILSVLAFLLVLVRVFRIDRERIGRWERLPFDDNAARGKEATP